MQSWIPTNIRLGDVLSKVVDNRGKTPTWGKDGYDLIETTSIIGNNKYPDFSLITKRVSRDTFETWFRSGHPIKGDILFATVGANIGSISIMKETRGCIAQNLVALRPNKEIIDADFLYYFLSWNRTQRILRNLDIGAAQPSIKVPHLLEFKIPTPPLPVQRRIAAILCAYDDLIENNTRRIQILEEMARRIYDEWFVRFRFPRHENVRMIESELGLIPVGWSVVTLDKVAKINSLSIRRGKEPTYILYVDIASVSTGKIDSVQEFSFTDAPGRARRIVRHGDIIWSNVRPNRKSFALITDPPQNMIVSTGFTVISASSVPYSFLYHALTTEDFASYLTNRAKGAAYPAVGSEDFADAKIIIPSSELLSTFNELAEPMQMEKNLLLKKNLILNRTRDLLLPKLISGEIDVSNFPNPSNYYVSTALTRKRVL